MTQTMKAIRLDQTGPPENFHLVEAPRPALAPDGILIRVAYAGLIYADAEARRGTYYKTTPQPWFPGREAAGIVEAVGGQVVSVKPGDRVAALVHGAGCYAEYVQARTNPDAPSDVVRLPDHVTFTQALVYLVNFRLAHLVFHAWARVPAGAVIMIHGAAGGMGAMLLQLAKKHGCESIAIVRGESELAFCRDLGAAHVIDAKSQNYADTIRALYPGGVQFSFNGVGGDTINRDPTLLAPLGELMCYGYVAGKAPFDLFALDRSLAIKTFNADNFLRTPHFAAATDAMNAWFKDGRLLDVGRVFPLAEAATAHRALEEGSFLGKIALAP